MANTYQVQPGDTLSGIAQRYNVPVNSLSGYRSGNPNLIFPNEKINLPSNAANTSTPQGHAFTPPNSNGASTMQPNFSSAPPNYSSVPKQPQQNFSALPKPTPAPTSQPNWLSQQVDNIGKAIVPQVEAAQPPPRKTFNVASHPDAVSTPGYVNGTPDWVKPMIQRAAEKFNVPTALLSALIKQESNFNPNATSPVGARGIAQFMPGTAQGMGVDTSDPESSINGAAQYLRRSWDRFGSPELALASYNAGGNAVNQYGGIPPYKETQNYVKNIMAMAGEIHQSSSGPLHDTLNEIKKQSQKQTNPTKGVAGASTQKPFALPSGIISPLAHPNSAEDIAVARIRAAKPELSNVPDAMLRRLYEEYGNKILVNVP